jgi:hypothetical protein
LFTTFLVARLLLADLDPARLSATTGPSGLVLDVLLWLTVALVALIVALEGATRRGWLGAALLAGLAGLLAWGGPTNATYRYAAELVGWQIAAVAGTFWLLRNLLASADDLRRLFAVATASLAALAATLGLGTWLGLQPVSPAEHLPDGLRLQSAEVGSGRADALEGGTTALAVVFDHPLVGTGGGNLTRHTLPITPPPTPRVSNGTGNSFIWLAVHGGLGALVLGGLLVFGIWQYPYLLPGGHDPLPPPTPRYEFSIGGILGLLLAFELRVLTLPTSTIVPLGGVTLVQALIWFIVYGMSEHTDKPITHRLKGAWQLGLLLVAGSFAVDLPQVPALVHGLAVLAAGIRLHDPAPLIRGWPGWFRWLTVPAAIAVGITYVNAVVRPAVVAEWYVRQARQAQALVPTYWADWQKAANGPAKEHALQTLRLGIVKGVVQPLIRAEHAEPSNVNRALELLAWYRALWRADPTAQAVAEQMMHWGLRANQLDPLGPAAPLAIFENRLLFARHSADKRDTQFAEAERYLRRVLACDPALAATLHYELAATQLAVQAETAGLKSAGQALQLDTDAPGPRYRLTDAQRQQVKKWLNVPE